MNILSVLKSFINLRHGDSEFAQRKDKRLKEIQTLKGRQEILQSTCKVTEHQAEQLKGALQQLRTEMQFARNESSRIQRILGSFPTNVNLILIFTLKI